MLLPEKHITLAESTLGLGGFILITLKEPATMDRLYARVLQARTTRELPAYHDFDSLVLSILFLFAVGAVTTDGSDTVRRCAS